MIVTVLCCGYEASREIPNIVVDGSPNEGTVLTLTHWPGYPVEPGLSGDLSAEVVFNYLDRLRSTGSEPTAPYVTNNHFDQDGLVSIHALVRPEESLEHRELLIDLARAGDFATYNDRRAARASMTFSRFAEREMSADYSAFVDGLYNDALPLVLPVLLDNERFREYWADEDAELTRCEEALSSGMVTVKTDDGIDLAVVSIPEDFDSPGGHRFGGEQFSGLHPMALNNTVDQFRLLLIRGRRYRYVDRYETWVQYQSRRPLPRVDLRPLAEMLTSLETRSETWRATGPGSLTPELTHSGESSLKPGHLLSLLNQHLRSQPAAWNPYIGS